MRHTSHLTKSSIEVPQRKRERVETGDDGMEARDIRGQLEGSKQRQEEEH